VRIQRVTWSVQSSVSTATLEREAVFQVSIVTVTNIGRSLIVTQVRLTSSVVEFGSTVTDLGAMLDNQLSLQAQVAAVCRSCFYQLRQLRVVRRSLTRDVLQSLVQAFVHCRLDYCNAILTGPADGQIRRLHAVQNAAARLVSVARCRDPSRQYCVVFTRYEYDDKSLGDRLYKSAAVAEMGDRVRNRHGPKRGKCCAPFAERWEPV